MPENKSIIPKRVWCSPLFEGEHILDTEAAHYVLHVLRCRVGDPLILFDGCGKTARAVISGIKRTQVTLLATQLTDQTPMAIHLTVALAQPRGERSDWAVEKLTELGITGITWVTFERSASVGHRSHRLQRLRRVALTAAAQAGRADIPQFEGPLPLMDLIDPEHCDGAACFVADPNGPIMTPAGVKTPGATSGCLVIGPEGGLTRHELELLTHAGYTRMGLGRFVLRVETAAVVGAATVMSALTQGLNP